MSSDRPNLHLVPDAGHDSSAGIVRLDTAGEQTLRRLLNLRLKASDGSIQPKRTSAEKMLCERYYAQEKEIRRTADNVNRLRYAIVDLASIDLSPSQLLEALSPTFDQPIIRERLERAVDCLSRFAEEWQRHQAKQPPGTS